MASILRRRHIPLVAVFVIYAVYASTLPVRGAWGGGVVGVLAVKVAMTAVCWPLTVWYTMYVAERQFGSVLPPRYKQIELRTWRRCACRTRRLLSKVDRLPRIALPADAHVASSNCARCSRRPCRSGGYRLDRGRFACRVDRVDDRVPAGRGYKRSSAVCGRYALLSRLPSLTLHPPSSRAASSRAQWREGRSRCPLPRAADTSTQALQAALSLHALRLLSLFFCCCCYCCCRCAPSCPSSDARAFSLPRADQMVLGC